MSDWYAQKGLDALVEVGVVIEPLVGLARYVCAVAVIADVFLQTHHHSIYGGVVFGQRLLEILCGGGGDQFLEQGDVAFDPCDVLVNPAVGGGRGAGEIGTGFIQSHRSINLF